MNSYAPLLLTFFLFLTANLIIIPIFDVLSLINHGNPRAGRVVLRARPARRRDRDRQLQRHRGAGDRDVPRDHHCRYARTASCSTGRIVPHAPVWLYPLLIPLKIIGMLVRPFALTMRLAANMTGGHIAILAILSFVFIFFELFGQAAAMGSA